jgi:hypothetical protein
MHAPKEQPFTRTNSTLDASDIEGTRPFTKWSKFATRDHMNKTDDAKVAWAPRPIGHPEAGYRPDPLFVTDIAGGWGMPKTDVERVKRTQRPINDPMQPYYVFDMNATSVHSLMHPNAQKIST